MFWGGGGSLNVLGGGKLECSGGGGSLNVWGVEA